MELTIDGKTIEALEGETILSAARRGRVLIPTLCYMEKLLPIGSCRLCVVEVAGCDKPVTACTTRAAAGMSIRTNTPALAAMRKEILEFILLTHPLDCALCDISGRCVLERLVKEYGAEAPVRRIPVAPRPETPYATPAILYRPDRCISCSRCVRACREVVGRDVLDLTGNGIGAAMKVVAPDRCISCGECLSVCPVGALTDTADVSREPGSVKKTATVCAYCGVGCTMELNVEENTIKRVTTNEFVGTNRGSLCVKGRFGFSYVNSPERLTVPMIRKDGELRQSTWDEALDYVATKLGRIKGDFGPDSIAGLTSAKCTNEDNYLFQKFLRAGIGTNNIDHCARL
jgi:predicted molibdopterin-dependent oxidoreductase YjgC